MVKIKIIVIYDSISNNTKKIAEEISTTLNCKSIFIDDVSKYRIENYDLIILGTPVHEFRPTKKVKQFLDNIKSKYCAFFCTYGAPFFGKKSAETCLNYMKERVGTKVIGEFKCLGFHHILRTYRNHPNQKDLVNARNFAKELLKKVK